jgi:two-component system sensor histidine kinase UhpB
VTAERLRRAERELAGLSQRLHDAVEEERRSVAREIHDELGQTVASVHLLLDRAPERPEALQEARELTAHLGDLLRDVALDLRPALLDDLGVPDAVRSLAERVARSADLAVEVTVAESGRPPARVETAAYRIVQEALTNVVRHSGARRVGVALTVGPAGITASVRDDGRGFVPGEVPAGHVGLIGMVERARLLGGWCQVRSGPTGTEVSAWLPASS